MKGRRRPIRVLVKELDYHATYEKLLKQGIRGLYQTEKGLIQFWLDDVLVQIPPSGNKMLIFCCEEQLDGTLQLLKSLCVDVSGKPCELSPIKEEEVLSFLELKKIVEELTELKTALERVIPLSSELNDVVKELTKFKEALRKVEKYVPSQPLIDYSRIIKDYRDFITKFLRKFVKEELKKFTKRSGRKKLKNDSHIKFEKS